MGHANRVIVYQDAANIKKLTKADMISFYQHFILPTSPARAKLAIHLSAQGATTTTNSTSIVEKGLKALGLDNKDKKDAEDGEVPSVETTDANGTKPFIITDVREFKSKLQISAGPQPVKHISEFEELDAKL